MIIKWKQQRMKVIPILAGTIAPENLADASGKEQIILFPGPNEVNDIDWKACRGMVLDQLANGDLVEVADIKEPTKEGEPVKVSGKKFNSLPAAEKISLIKETVSLDTLNKWLAASTSDEVRMAIKQQIDDINKDGKKE